MNSRLFTSTTSYRTGEEVSLSPAMDDRLVEDKLHHTVMAGITDLFDEGMSLKKNHSSMRQNNTEHFNPLGKYCL